MNAVFRFTSHISGLTSRIYHFVWSRPILKDTLVTTVLSVIGKGAGFLVPLFVAAWFGVSTETDAFFFAYGLILFLTGIFAPVVESVIVPFIAQIRVKDETEVRTFLGTTLVFAIGGLLVLSGFFLVILEPLLLALTRFPQESIELIFRLFLETIPLLVFLVTTSVLSGALNAYKLFVLPAVSPALRMMVTLLTIWVLKNRIGVHSIAMGYVTGEVFRLVLLGSEAVKRKMLVFKVTIDLKQNFVEFLRVSFYQVIGLVAVAFNPMVDKAMASWLSPGSVSILEYADRVYQIPMTFMSSGLFVVLLSHWSGDFYQEDKAFFRRKVINMAKIVGVGTLLFSFLLILARNPLVRFVYGYGKFPTEYLNPVATVWSLYLGGLAPTILGLIFARAHLAMKNTTVFMQLGIANCILHVLLNLVLINPFGIYGLAFSTTLTYSIISAGLCLTFLKIRMI